MLPATLLALHRQLPLADLSGFREGRTLGGGYRLQSDRRDPRRILVVDDSALAGNAMRGARAALASHPLAERLTFGAVYVTSMTPKDALDLSYTAVELPRVFEWNILHHSALGSFCVDIDGVLCRDPSESENDDGPAYARFLAEASVLNVPTGEIGWVVTSRLERYRAETEAWLAGAGIRYRELVMHPAATAAERRAAMDHAARKAQLYRSVPAILFVESDARQARAIADSSGKPVYCVDAGMMVHPGLPMAHGARPPLPSRLVRTVRHVRGRIGHLTRR